MHLLVINKLLSTLKPKTVIIDPISSLITIGTNSEVRAMLIRLMDTLKIYDINAVFTSLTHSGNSEFKDLTVDAVSSLADTWIHLTNDHQQKEEQVRNLLIIKSRGMGHSNRHQEFIITNKGLRFLKSKA